MRILLDECLDWRLSRALSGHYCVSVSAMGWSGLTNGQLLRTAELHFDVFLTADSNLTSQQNLKSLDLAVVILAANSNRLADTLMLMPQVLSALTTIQPREVVLIRAEG